MTIDPRAAGPRPPFPGDQQQARPGLTSRMRPAPDHGETSYVGKGLRLCENAFVVWKDLTARCAKRPGFQPRMAAMSGPAPRIAITRFML